MDRLGTIPAALPHFPAKRHAESAAATRLAAAKGCIAPCWNEAGGVEIAVAGARRLRASGQVMP
jgi:hypothetical protein